MTQPSEMLRAPPSPTYAEIGAALHVLDGEAVKHVRELMNTIFDQAAAASSLVWSDPECWIDQRLSAELASLARKV